MDRQQYRRSNLVNCERKRRYGSWGMAQKVAKAHNRREHFNHADPYRCRACGGFHVGTPPEAY